MNTEPFVLGVEPGIQRHCPSLYRTAHETMLLPLQIGFEFGVTKHRWIRTNHRPTNNDTLLIIASP